MKCHNINIASGSAMWVQQCTHMFGNSAGPVGKA